MTGQSRPNLGGLFTGAEAPDARQQVASPRVTETGQARSAGTRSSEPPPQSEQYRWAALEWIDPVKATERYFGFLQFVLDANRYVAMGCANAVKSLPKRAGLWR